VLWRVRRCEWGMEASGHARWFQRLLAELQFELWIGNAAEIRAKRVRKQKTDRQDARLILQLITSRSRQAQTLKRSASRTSTNVRHNDQFKNGDSREVNLISLDLTY
jgi:hypothetical protein